MFILAVIAILFFSSANLITAHSEEDFSQTEAIINQSVSCDNLTNDQLELIGDYYMEQMHPGEAHEYMDQMMGGEGSESLKQMHINIALRIYCGETSYTGYGMMGYGMMGNYYYSDQNNTSSNVFGWLFNILLIAGIVFLIIFLAKQIQRDKRRKE